MLSGRPGKRSLLNTHEPLPRFPWEMTSQLQRTVPTTLFRIYEGSWNKEVMLHYSRNKNFCVYGYSDLWGPWTYKTFLYMSRPKYKSLYHIVYGKTVGNKWLISRIIVSITLFSRQSYIILLRQLGVDQSNAKLRTASMIYTAWWIINIKYSCYLSICLTDLAFRFLMQSIFWTEKYWKCGAFIKISVHFNRICIAILETSNRSYSDVTRKD